MEFTEINLDFYKIDDGEIEKLIEIWVFFNKKDEPYPINGKIFLNKKSPDIDPYCVMLSLLYPVLKTNSWVGRFYNVCLHCRMQRPVKFLYEKYLENCKGEVLEKEPNGDYDVNEKKPRKTKPKEK